MYRLFASRCKYRHQTASSLIGKSILYNDDCCPRVVVELGDLKNLSSINVNPAYVAPPLNIASGPPLRFKYAPVSALPQMAFHPSSLPSPRHRRTILLNPVNEALNIAQLLPDVSALTCNADIRCNIPPVISFPNIVDGMPMIPPPT